MFDIAKLSAEVTDPVDFPEQSKAPGLRSLDSSLRCPICGELFDGPVTLVCGHCFCSLCVRQTLNEKQSCPTCRKPDMNEGHLRINIAMEDAVSAWKLSRSFILDLLSKAEAPTATEPPNKKRKLSDDSRIDASQQQQDCVTCPLCAKSVKFLDINAHLDRGCKEPQTKGSSASSKSQWQNILGPKSQAATKKPKGKERATQESEEDEPLPKKSYGVLKDKAVRDLLHDHDLPANGDRNTLIARHQQWVILYNANLDKSEKLRKGVEALRRDLQQWETQTQQKNKAKREIKDSEEYQRQNQSEFVKLVALARSKKPDSSATIPEAISDVDRDVIVLDDET